MPVGVPIGCPTHVRNFNQQFTLWMTDKQKDRLAKYAIATKKSASEVLRDLIDSLPEYEDKKK